MRLPPGTLIHPSHAHSATGNIYDSGKARVHRPSCISPMSWKIVDIWSMIVSINLPRKHANNRTDCSAQCFTINKSKSNSMVLCLDFRQSAQLPSKPAKRHGSFASLLSVPSLSSRSSRISTEVEATSPKSEIPRHLDNLSSLTITFTDARSESQSASNISHKVL